MPQHKSRYILLDALQSLCFSIVTIFLDFFRRELDAVEANMIKRGISRSRTICFVGMLHRDSYLTIFSADALEPEDASILYDDELARAQ